jgi:hypothetical protein
MSEGTKKCFRTTGELSHDRERTGLGKTSQTFNGPTKRLRRLSEPSKQNARDKLTDRLLGVIETLTDQATIEIMTGLAEPIDMNGKWKLRDPPAELNAPIGLSGCTRLNALPIGVTDMNALIDLNRLRSVLAQLIGPRRFVRPPRGFQTARSRSIRLGQPRSPRLGNDR